MESTINTNTARAIIASQRSILSTFFEHLSATMENIRAGTTDSRHWEVKIDKGLRDIARDCSSDTAAISKAATEAAKKSKNPFDLFLAHICTTIANATEEIAEEISSPAPTPTNYNTPRISEVFIANLQTAFSVFFEHLNTTLESIKAGTTNSRHWEVKIDKGLRDIARDCSSDTAAISKAANEAAEKSKNPFDLFLAHIGTTIANATEEIAKAAELFAKNGLDIRGCIACTRTTATGHHLASTAIPSKPSKAELIKGDQVEIELTLLSTTTHKNTPTREGSL